MMEEEFYATVKLTSGEEIVSKICYLSDEDSLLVDRPMLVEKITHKKSGKTVEGFQFKDWITSTYETMFVIRMEQVITITELDKKIEDFYLKNISEDECDSIDINPKSLTKQMGYLGSVKETKQMLENLFNKS
jgi:hypothetical protein